jgi:hypothetical protein
LFTEEELQNLINQKLSTRGISKEKQCSQATVRYWLKKVNLVTNPSYLNPEILTEKPCGKCKTVKLAKDFAKRANRPGKLQSYCRKCNNTSLVDRRVFKKKCVEYKGGSCESCGYSSCVGALEFHHKNPAEKDYCVSRKRTFTDEVKLELDKCSLLCSNCHREEHYKLKMGDVGFEPTTSSLSRKHSTAELITLI